MRHAQLVIGPAGSGKSTYVKAMSEHCQTMGRTVHCINLDPAAEELLYECSIDVRELVSVEDVMVEMNLGPNGGLVYAMEYLVTNIDWLQDELGEYDDDYYIIDCPGQIELYSHVPVMRDICDKLQQMGMRVCAVYLIDSQFAVDASKFLSAGMQCLSTMIMLELPHINVLSKMDLVTRNKRHMRKFLDCNSEQLLQALRTRDDDRFTSLTHCIADVLDSYGMVSYLPLSSGDHKSLQRVLYHIDHAIQYGEDHEPKEPREGGDDSAAWDDNEALQDMLGGGSGAGEGEGGTNMQSLD